MLELEAKKMNAELKYSLKKANKTIEESIINLMNYKDILIASKCETSNFDVSELE
jgi:hypothetical protein